jgi:hypothetical protein
MEAQRAHGSGPLSFRVSEFENRSLENSKNIRIYIEAVPQAPFLDMGKSTYFEGVGGLKGEINNPAFMT